MDTSVDLYGALETLAQAQEQREKKRQLTGWIFARFFALTLK